MQLVVQEQVEKIKINLIIENKQSCSIISFYFLIILVFHYSQRFSADFSGIIIEKTTI